MDAIDPQTDYISKERFRKEAHISKRKALALIQSGEVPAIDTHRKTRRYLILYADALRYIQSKNSQPRRNIPPKVFCHGACADHQVSAAKLRCFLRSAWADQPDVLSTSEIADLLGYSTVTISKWVKKWGLEGAQTCFGRRYTKEALIEALAGREAQAIEYKSQKYCDLLRRAFYA